MFKVRALGIYLFVYLFISSHGMAASNSGNSSKAGNSKSAVRNKLPALFDATLMQQQQLEDEGKGLEELGLYDEALQKYQQALDPALIKYPGDKAMAMGAIFRIHQLQEKYDLALTELEWFKDWFEKHNASHPFYELKKPEIDAQILYKKTGDKKYIYDHIAWIRKEHQRDLPPMGFDALYVSYIIRLYDFIRDYDSGIAFMDEIMAYQREKKEGRREDYKVYDRIKTSAEAEDCADLDVRQASKRNPEWRACKLIREFLLIREGFEKDKQNGGPDCAGQEYCVGSATKALIKSDYFPW